MGANVHKLAGVLSVSAWRRAFLSLGVAAGVEHLSVLRNVGPVHTLIDIGANRGQFALVARDCFPDARIISFEPLERPATVYQRVFRKDPRVELVQAAVGCEPGHAVIHISKRDDSSSLLAITTQQSNLFPGTEERGTGRVRVLRLVDVLAPTDIACPALLKLDVQGFELPALAGCADVLECFDYVYVECSFIELYEGQALAAEVINWLHERCFVLRGVYNLTYDRQGQAVQGDFLFNRQGTS